MADPDSVDIAAQERFAAMKARAERLGDDALDALFREARTVNGWLDKEVSDDQLRDVFDLMKMGPTSANISPARILFIRSAAAKERLSPHLSRGNRAKTMAAPACAILAIDYEFYDHLGYLFPHEPKAASWFKTTEESINSNAFRNATLQGAYFIMAVRAVGLDAGPMSGFDNAGVDAEFFAGTSVRSNFLCTVGYGDPKTIFKRSPRFDFDTVCEIL